VLQLFLAVSCVVTFWLCVLQENANGLSGNWKLYAGFIIAIAVKFGNFVWELISSVRTQASSLILLSHTHRQLPISE
jgi:hypothetical protein